MIPKCSIDDPAMSQDVTECVLAQIYLHECVNPMHNACALETWKALVAVSVDGLIAVICH